MARGTRHESLVQGRTMKGQRGDRRSPAQGGPVGDGTVDQRETTFQWWRMLADRSPTRTAATSRKEFGIGIKPDTIRQWSKRYGWAERASHLFREAAPDYFERTKMNLVGAAPGASSYLNDVANGRVKPDKVRALVSFGIVDRIGFLPHTRREAERGHTPAHQSASADEYETLSDEELRQAIAARVADLR